MTTPASPEDTVPADTSVKRVANPHPPLVAPKRGASLGGLAVGVISPVPTEIWEEVAASDPSATPFQWPSWRDCVCSSGKWQDASRLYEFPGGRRVVFMLARRKAWPGPVTVARSWPERWGPGGMVANGGVRPEEVTVVCAELAAAWNLSVTVRPGFSAAPNWTSAADRGFMVPRTVHVAEFGGSFEEYFSRSVSAKRRGNLRTAGRHIERLGVTITSGNSPALVQAFYDVYLRSAKRRAAQGHLPTTLVMQRLQRAEPHEKFAIVASRLGRGCRISAAWWEGRPIGATISLYAGNAAVGWRAAVDRSAEPARYRLWELLAVEALRHACESGCLHMELGESAVMELAEIKERLGGREIASPEYCFQRLPVAQARLAYQRYRGRVERLLAARTSA